MACDEVGVKMREDDVLDSKRVIGRERKILIDVALRIDDGGGVRLLVADQIRRVRQAGEIELLEDQENTSAGS